MGKNVGLSILKTSNVNLIMSAHTNKIVETKNAVSTILDIKKI